MIHSVLVPHGCNVTMKRTEVQVPRLIDSFLFASAHVTSVTLHVFERIGKHLLCCETFFWSPEFSLLFYSSFSRVLQVLNEINRCYLMTPVPSLLRFARPRAPVRHPLLLRTID